MVNPFDDAPFHASRELSHVPRIENRHGRGLLQIYYDGRFAECPGDVEHYLGLFLDAANLVHTRQDCLKCTRPAVLVTIAFDAPPGIPTSERVLHLCFRHFWDWNTHSLRRRGFHEVADTLSDLTRRGLFDDPPEDRFPVATIPEREP